MNIDKLFLLLQINDGAFPIGSYTHSFGLETYILRKEISTVEDFDRYIRRNLSSSFLYNELLAADLAYQAATRDDLREIMSLEEILFASKAPRELREAANKIGIRFVKTALPFLKSEGIFARYALEDKRFFSHAVAYGVFVADSKIDKEAALAAYLYAQSAAMVTNCVKTVPLSQTQGQKILVGLHDYFDFILEKLGALTKDDLGRNAPGLDIASMEHERLYSRLYIS